MTLDDIKELVMLQLGEDTEDMDEFEVLLDFYLEKGYRELMKARKRGLMADVAPLSATSNLLPAEYHSALVDYATYGILANGNAAKQQRSQMFLMRFEDVRSKMPSERDEAAYSENGGVWKFTGLYDY